MLYSQIRSVISGLLLLLPTAASAHAATQVDVAKSADIVFIGTVSQLNATASSDIPQSGKNMVVKVDSVLKAPTSAGELLRPGDSVTVEALDPGSFKTGMQATFFVNTAAFGNTIVVSELGHAAVSPTAAAAETSARSMVAQAQTSVLSDQVSNASAVITGTVQSVAPQALNQGPFPGRISEHEPMWQTAIVSVNQAIKGVSASQQVAVRFPASRDVVWHEWPKLETGQSYTLLLHPDTRTGLGPLEFQNNAIPTFIAPKPEDVRPVAESVQIRALVRH